MKKTTFAVIAILVLFLSAAWLYLYNQKSNKNFEINQTSIIKEKTQEQNPIEEEKKEENPQDKVAQIKKRISLKSLLIKWDYFIENNQPKYALQKYLKAYMESPEDEQIIRKVAETYFEINNYKNSATFYWKLKEITPWEKNKMLLSIVYSVEPKSSSDTSEAVLKIKELDLTEEEEFYYTTSISCLNNFKECKNNFEIYLFDEKNKITLLELKNLKSAIQTYNDFKSEEIYYKDTLLATAFLNNKMYPVSAFIADNILVQKDNYLTALKVWGESFYKIWNYEKANLMLKKTYRIDESNPDVSYILWVINFKLWKYEDSNLYLQASLNNGYENEVELYRKLVYNYFLLWDETNLIKYFEKLIEKPEATQNDFYLGIYSAINSDSLLQWVKWANIWLERFPEDEMFRGYYAWIYREWWEYDISLKHLDYWYKVNSRNPFITLNYGLTYMAIEKKKKAKEYLERTIEINKDWEFWQIASENLKILNDL